jgi:myo-inositol-1(or 4)-monophosphatase
MKEYKEMSLEINDLTKTVGKFILNERKNFNQGSVEKKGPNDFVTYIDKKSEELLVEKLSKILPESGFITEEKTSTKKGAEYNWIIDPLDGTTNYIHGMPCFCISIGLIKNNDLVLGVVHELNLDECFYGWKNGGAYLNGNRIYVSENPTLADSLLATGFPYLNFDRIKPYMEIFDYCMRHTHGLRRLGSAASDLAYVACGRFEGFYEYGLNPWDVAGGALLVKEAGGIVTDFTGKENYLFGEEIIATNTKIASEFLSIVKSKFS